MQGAHARALAPQRAADVHQARVSAAVQTSARVSRMRRSLSESIAIDMSAFLTANVPPKPQHSSRVRQLDEVDAAHRAQQPQRPVADAAAARSEWQVGW